MEGWRRRSPLLLAGAGLVLLYLVIALARGGPAQYSDVCRNRALAILADHGLMAETEAWRMQTGAWSWLTLSTRCSVSLDDGVDRWTEP